MLFFEEGGKTEGPGKKTLGARTRTNNKLNPHICDTGSGNQTWATLVGGEHSHHCTIPTPPSIFNLRGVAYLIKPSILNPRGVV